VFLESSRYYGQTIITSKARNGKDVAAIALRRLPDIKGEQVMVKGNDRLDLMAGQRYDDGTWFWHIADANRELKAARLTEQPSRIINVPED